MMATPDSLEYDFREQSTDFEKYANYDEKECHIFLAREKAFTGMSIREQDKFQDDFDTHPDKTGLNASHMRTASNFSSLSLTSVS